MRHVKWFKNLTPEQAWEQYVGTSVELFISNFRFDGIPDIGEMCRHYASEIPEIFNELFTQDQIEQIGNLLTLYVNEYIEGKEGIENLNLYTTQELDEMDKEEVNELMEIIKASFKDSIVTVGRKIKNLYWEFDIDFDDKDSIEFTADGGYKDGKLLITTAGGKTVTEIYGYEIASNIITQHNDALDELCDLLNCHNSKKRETRKQK